MFQIATLLKKLERFFLAITFAEANLKEIALSFFVEHRKEQRKRQKETKRPSKEERPRLRL